MFLRILRSHAAPGSLSKTQIDSIGQDVVAALKRLPGFERAYVASDADTGHAVTVSAWDNSAHAQFESSQLGDLIPRLQQAGVQMDAPEIYEINAHS